MGKPNGAAALFALDLRRAIDRNDISLRRLGKLTDPTDPERGRRRVQRHLSGRTSPTDASRRVYADILQAPELLPESDEEDESMDGDLLQEARAKAQEDPRALAVWRRVLDEAAA